KIHRDQIRVVLGRMVTYKPFRRKIVMRDQFIPYELAVKLKELGFDKPCLGVWNIPNDKYEVTLVYGGKLHEGYINDIQSFKVCAPLWQQAFDWFREKHNLFCKIDFFQSDEFEALDYDYSIFDLSKP